MTDIKTLEALWAFTKNQCGWITGSDYPEDTPHLIDSLEQFSYEVLGHETWLQYTRKWEKRTIEEALSLKAIDKFGPEVIKLEDSEELDYKFIFARELTEIINRPEVQEIISPDIAGKTFPSEHSRHITKCLGLLK